MQKYKVYVNNELQTEFLHLLEARSFVKSVIENGLAKDEDITIIGPTGLRYKNAVR